MTVKLGNASQSASTVLSGTGGWARATVTLTPTADRTGVVLAVYRSTNGGQGYTWTMDDAVVWDSGTPDLNVPTSETVNDANGAIIRTILPPGDPGTDEPLVTTTTRDSLGRPTVVTVNAIAGNGTGDTTSNLASTTHYDALGRTDYTLDQAGIKTSFTFDRLGRAIETIQNDTAGSAPTSLTDDKDVTSTFGYNALGELIAYCPAMQVTLFGGGTPCDRTATSVAAGDAYTRGWHWTYDDAGHQASEIPPVNQTATPLDTTTWAYNAAGQLTTQVSQNTTPTVHRHTDLTYDNAGRVTQSIVYQNAGTATPKIRTTTSYFGDGAQNAIAVYLNGSGTASDTISFTYDTAGRPDQVKRSTTVLTDFAWNADGTLASRADGDAGVVGTTSFTYDWAKRIAGATLPSGWQSGGGTASFTYRPDGLLATRTFNSDANPVTYAYDAAKRPTSLAKTLTGGSLTLTQAWDRTGNITSEGRSISGPTGDAGTNTQSFTYDNLGRLTGSTNNRRTKTEGADSYGATYDRTDALLAVTKNGGVAVTSAYDTYGNLLTNPETGTTAGIVTLAYDLADRTIGITPTGGTASTLALDALGRVRARTTGSSVDTYSYAGPTNNVVRIANAGGSGTTTDSVLDPSGVRFGTKTSGTVAWLLADLHGSVAVGLNQAGTSVTDALRYDGAGMTVATWPGGGSAATKSWKYQGRFDVAASGPSLYDFEARELSPGLGAFTSNDTVLGSATNPRQLNRYVYVAGNPTSFTDPDGHAVFLAVLGMIAFGGGIAIDIAAVGATVTTVVGAGLTLFAAHRVFEHISTEWARTRNVRKDKATGEQQKRYEDALIRNMRDSIQSKNPLGDPLLDCSKNPKACAVPVVAGAAGILFALGKTGHSPADDEPIELPDSVKAWAESRPAPSVASPTYPSYLLPPGEGDDGTEILSPAYVLESVDWSSSDYFRTNGGMTAL